MSVCICPRRHRLRCSVAERRGEAGLDGLLHRLAHAERRLHINGAFKEHHDREARATDPAAGIAHVVLTRQVAMAQEPLPGRTELVDEVTAPLLRQQRSD